MDEIRVYKIIITTLIVLLLCLPLFFYFSIKRNFIYWKNRNVPFKPPKFPFGNVEDVVLVRKSIGDFVYQIYKTTTEKFIGVWVFGTPHLIVCCPELIKLILVKDFKYFQDRSILSDAKIDPISSQMLFLIKNPRWKVIRSKMNGVFTTGKIRSMSTLIDKAGKDMINYLNTNSSKGNDILESRNLTAKYSTDVIVSCAFGIESECFVQENAPFRMVSRKMFDVTFINAVRFFSYFLIPALVKVLRIKFLDPYTTTFLSKTVWQTIKERERTKIKRNDVIDTLIDLQNSDAYGDGTKFDGDRVVAQPVQMFIGGFETTSSTVSFALYELSLQQNLQTRVREEITSTLETFGSFTYEAIKSMSYLDQILSETLRKYPVLPYLDRRCLADYQIPGTNVTIEKGTPIYISIFGLHYDPKYFPNPDKFDPERFSKENKESFSSNAYIPFGAGPRYCIGARFGSVSTKMGLAHILSKFRVETCSETPVKMDYDPKTFFLNCKGGLKLRFIKLPK